MDAAGLVMAFLGVRCFIVSISGKMPKLMG